MQYGFGPCRLWWPLTTYFLLLTAKKRGYLLKGHRSATSFRTTVSFSQPPYSNLRDDLLALLFLFTLPAKTNMRKGYPSGYGILSAHYPQKSLETTG